MKTTIACTVILLGQVAPSLSGSSVAANWITAVSVTFAVLYLRHISKKFDQIGRTVGYIDRDLHVIASGANIPLPRRD